MGLFTDLVNNRAALSDIGTLSKPSAFFQGWFGGGASNSGKVVNEKSALTVSAMYQGIGIKARTMGTLPLEFMRRTKGGAWEAAEDDERYTIVHDSFNSIQTAFQAKHFGQQWSDLKGNTYYFKDQDINGKLYGLIPIHPSRVEPEFDSMNRLNFWVTTKSGGREFVPDTYMLHIPGGLSDDGYIGKSFLEYARDSVGMMLALDEHNSAQFKNGARLGGVLQHPTNMSDKAYDRLKADFEKKYVGSSNTFKTLLLEEGTTFSPITMNAEEMQLIESRKLNIVDGANWLNLPPDFLGFLERTNFNTAEQMFTRWAVLCVQPDCTRWEQAFNKSLLSEKERRKFKFKFNIDALVRADFEKRNAGYAAGRQWGWWSADDVRAMENQPPIPEGKGAIYLQPAGYVEAGTPPPEPKAPQPVTKSETEQPENTADGASTDDKKPDKTAKKGAPKRAFERVFSDKFAQILSKESNFLTKNAKNSRNVSEMVNIFGEWYRSHMSTTAANLRQVSFAVVECFAVLDVNTERKVQEYCEEFARSYVAGQCAEIYSILEADEVQPLAQELADEWRRESILVHSSAFLDGLLSRLEIGDE